MSNIVEIDTQRVDKILATLSNEDQVKDIMNEGLDAMSQIYYNSIVGSLRKEMGAAADTAGIRKGGWYGTMGILSDGIKINEKRKDEMIWGVHALSDFRLRFFEDGVPRKRYTKGTKIKGYVVNKRTGKVNHKRLERSGKPANRGTLPANHFFANGVSAAEQPAMQALTQSIYNALKNRGIDIQ